MKIFLKVLLHAFLILAVMVVPVWVYEAIENSHLKWKSQISFIGGITYFIYATYWILKIRSSRVKTILLSLFIEIVVACTTVSFSMKYQSLVFICIPLMVSLVPAGLSLLLFFQGRAQLGRTYLYCTLVLAPFACCIVVANIYGLALSGMAGMRY